MALNGPEQPYQQRALMMRNLLNRQVRNARRSGDFKTAYEAIEAGDRMGLPVGRPASIEEIRGAGTQNYRRDQMMIGQRQDQSQPQSQGGYNLQRRPMPGTGFMQGQGAQGPPTPEGLPGESSLLPPANIQDDMDSGFTQGPPGNPVQMPVTQGVNRYVGNQLVGANGQTNQGMVGGEAGVFEQRFPSPIRPVADGGQGRAAYPSVHNVDQRAAFSRAWQAAKTQDQRRELVNRARALGVPMDEKVAAPYLQTPNEGQGAPPPQAATQRFTDTDTFRNFERAAQTNDYGKYTGLRGLGLRAESAFKQGFYGEQAKQARQAAEDAQRRSVNGPLDDFYARNPQMRDADAYAAARKAEVAENQRQLDELVGIHQTDMRDDIRNRAVMDVEIAPIPLPSGTARNTLRSSERTFGRRGVVEEDISPADLKRANLDLSRRRRRLY